MAISKVYNHPWDPCGKWNWLKVCTEKMLLKVLFQVIIWFQPNSTRASSKHRVHWGKLPVWPSVSSCNHHTKAMNLSMPHQGFLAWEQSLGGHHLLQAVTELHWAGTKQRGHGKSLTGDINPQSQQLLGWWLPSTLQPFVPVLPPTEVTELDSISVLPTRGMQLRTDVPETACMSTSPRDLTGAGWLGSSPTVQQHWEQERSPGWL